VWLRTPELDLTSFTKGATLRFQQFRAIEVGFDSGSIRILKAADDTELAVLEMTIDGTTTAWEQYSRNLPAEAFAEPIKIEFRLIADDVEEFAGWYLDDVEVIALP